ncbi:hydrogenase maturation protease [Streptomyces sp. NPDC056061]|uniref:hydrogenase maturation protease n=1 Tax=Streptomyces sp. NPDC056061 TaxID=3345700 RepID=UPI0035DF50A3
MSRQERISVIGVGNDYRHDDGVGWAVVARLTERVRQRPLPGDPRLLVCDGEPARLISLWEGAHLAVVVDCAHADPPCPGRIHRLELGSGRLERERHGTTSSHGLGLGSAAELARALDRLPGRLIVYAVEAADSSLGPGLSAPVAATIEPLAERIAHDIADHIGAAASAPGESAKP